MLSIIIPCLNEADNLARLLPQLLNGASSAYQVIVCDANSADKSLEIAKKYNCTTVEQTPAKRSVQLNAGAKAAKADYLLFLHADSHLPANFHEILAVETQRETKAACFKLAFDWPHWFLKFNAWFTRFNIPFVRYGDQGLLVQRNVFFMAGGYNENLFLLEDQEIVWRLKRHAPFKVLNATITTSARKYSQYGVYKLQAHFMKLTVMYYLGTSQKTLARWYTSFLQNTKG